MPKSSRKQKPPAANDAPQAEVAPVTRIAIFSPDFRDDLQYWVEIDRKTALRLLSLVDAILRAPFEGIGKPEPLRHLTPNTWSRRLTDEHRIVYRVANDRIEFLQARLHYQ